MYAKHCTGTIALLFCYEIKVTIMMIKLDRLWSPLILGVVVWMKRDTICIYSQNLGRKILNHQYRRKFRIEPDGSLLWTMYVALLLSCVEGGEAPKIDSICFGHGQVCSEIAKERGRYWHAWKIDVL